jgi:hypothetical protein
MQTREDRLIQRLQHQVRSGVISVNKYSGHNYRVRSPALLCDLEDAENALGFYLPSLLKRIYHEVGEGGFGPGYGLFRLNASRVVWNGADAINAIVPCYREERPIIQDGDADWVREENNAEIWPEGIVKICDWGCNMYSCLDCFDTPRYRILRIDYNRCHSEFRVESLSLLQWLEDWVDGQSLFDLDWVQSPRLPFPFHQEQTS